MKDIDSKEDQWRKLIIDMAMRFAEAALTSTDATDEMIQICKSIENEHHLIFDELLQMSQEDRTQREEIHLSVTNAFDRLSEKYSIDTKIQEILVENTTNIFEMIMKMMNKIS